MNLDLRFITLFLLAILCCSGADGSGLFVSLTSSKNEDPACVEETITFTCTIHGNALAWTIDGVQIITYNADDACGELTTTSLASYTISIVLASKIQDVDGFISLMTLSSSLATSVEVQCIAMNAPSLGECISPLTLSTFPATSVEMDCTTVNVSSAEVASFYKLQILGNPATPQNFTASQIVQSMKMKVFNLSWVLTNDIHSIQVYTIMTKDENGKFIENTTFFRPDLTFALIPVFYKIEYPQFFLITGDKCDKMSMSDMALIIDVTTTKTYVFMFVVIVIDAITVTCSVAIAVVYYFAIAVVHLAGIVSKVNASSKKLSKEGIVGAADNQDQTTLQVTNSKQFFEWKGYGLKLNIPSQALPDEHESCNISITISPSYRYQLLENTEFVSPVFRMTCIPVCVFRKPLTLEIQHCAPSSTNLLIVQRKDSSSSFEVCKGATFRNSYGVIARDHFCDVSVLQEGSNERLYWSQVSYMGPLKSRKIHFAVTWKVDYCLTKVRALYKAKNASFGQEQLLTFQKRKSERSISLDIPRKGRIQGDWKVLPTTTTTISKRMVDDCHTDEQYVPHCELLAKWTKKNKEIQMLEYLVDVLGTTDATFFTILIDSNNDFIGCLKKTAAQIFAVVFTFGFLLLFIATVLGYPTYYHNGDCKRVDKTDPYAIELKDFELLRYKNRAQEQDELRIIDELSPHWKELCIQLNENFKSIEDDHNKVKERCRTVLDNWLNNQGTKDYPSTWNGLIRLTDDIKETRRLSRRIERALECIV